MTVRSESRQARDIEELLQWTFREELPKGQERLGFAPGISPMFRLADLGTRVDDWSEEPGYPRALGEPHPDAVAIGKAVMAFEPEEAGLNERLGAQIDWPTTRRTMVGPLGGLLTDDEPTLKYLRIGIPGLVAMHAKLKTRPQWDLWPLPEPVIGANGKPKVQFEDERGQLIDGRKGRHYGPAARCPLMWFPAPQEAAFARIEYSIWWQALDTLADYLHDGLEDYEPLPPAAHPSPWVAKN